MHERRKDGPAQAFRRGDGCRGQRKKENVSGCRKGADWALRRAGSKETGWYKHMLTQGASV